MAVLCITAASAGLSQPWIVRVQMNHLVIDQTSYHQDGDEGKEDHQLLEHLLPDLLHWKQRRTRVPSKLPAQLSL